MKKIFIVLMVLLMGVFALSASTQAGVIKLVTSVTSAEPTFRLSTGMVNVDLSTVVDTAEIDNLRETTLNSMTAHRIAVDELLKGDHTVEFSVIQYTASRSTKTYKFSATATDLTLYQYPGVSGDTILVADTPHPAGDSEKSFNVESTVVNTFTNGVVTADKGTYGGSASELTLEYRGGLQEVGITVTKFTCTWLKNIHAVAGDYRATVTLTVTAS